MRDHRIGPDLFTDVLDVLNRHGFARGDDEHAGRAIFLISDLARIYEGSQDHPFGPTSTRLPSPPVPPEPPGPDSRSTVIVPPSELKTVLTALDIAADHKRNRAEMCADCPDTGPLATRRSAAIPAMRAAKSEPKPWLADGVGEGRGCPSRPHRTLQQRFQSPYRARHRPATSAALTTLQTTRHMWRNDEEHMQTAWRPLGRRPSRPGWRVTPRV
jgi:hypothetical protein